MAGALPSSLRVGDGGEFEELVLRVEVVPRAGTTPYVRAGNWPVVMLSLALVAAGWGWRRWRP